MGSPMLGPSCETACPQTRLLTVCLCWLFIPFKRFRNRSIIASLHIFCRSGINLTLQRHQNLHPTMPARRRGSATQPGPQILITASEGSAPSVDEAPAVPPDSDGRSDPTDSGHPLTPLKILLVICSCCMLGLLVRGAVPAVHRDPVFRSNDLVASTQQLDSIVVELQGQAPQEMSTIGWLLKASEATKSSLPQIEDSRGALLGETAPAFKEVGRLPTFANYQKCLRAVRDARHSGNASIASLDEPKRYIIQTTSAIKQAYTAVIREKRLLWRPKFWTNLKGWFVSPRTDAPLATPQQQYRELEHRAELLEVAAEAARTHRKAIDAEQGRFVTLCSTIDQLERHLQHSIHPPGISNSDSPAAFSPGMYGGIPRSSFLERMFLNAVKETMPGDGAAEEVEEWYVQTLRPGNVVPRG